MNHEIGSHEPGNPERHEHSHSENCHVTAFVNEQPVKLHSSTATGFAIKKAAIEQGVPIEESFLLHEQLLDGGSRLVGNEEQVHLREHIHFQAEPEKREYTVTVNEQPVKLHGNLATGAEIKAAAIKQGVPIEESFLLHEQLSDGAYRLVVNKEQVHLLEHIHFLAEPEKHEYTVTVNEQPVKLHENLATGAEIKAAAIRQGVLIQENFILQEELPNGTSRVIGDKDKVHLREHLRFTAIPPDDNS